MKRENIEPARLMERQLGELETKLAHFKSVEKLHISSSCTFDLQNYDRPSRIGQAFREVRASIVALLESQIATQKEAMKAIGADT